MRRSHKNNITSWFNGIAFALASLLLSVNTVAQEFKEGTHYTVLSQPLSIPLDGKAHVEEFFWYGCPHCFQLEKPLNEWKENLPNNVKFSQTPAQFSRAWRLHARLFYVAKALGVLDKVNTSIFRAIHLDKKRLLSKSDQREFLVEKANVSAADFDRAYDGFSVVSSLKRADQRVRQTDLRGVPALLVNGKYLVNSSVPGGHDAMLNVVDFLVKKDAK